MKSSIAIGIQDFAALRNGQYFYIDKTYFIKDWWESGDSVTLITRPRRFGKTLTMSMLECFFSAKYAGRGELFEGLKIWNEEKFRQLQGTYPVLFLSFAGVKHADYENTRSTLNGLIAKLYQQYEWMLQDEKFTETDRAAFREVTKGMDDSAAALSLNTLCEWLYRYYGKKCIVLLDEYDTPMQEAYIHGFWDELTSYFRALFNNTFKSNPYMERGIMTGITRISKESIFSDLNNLNVITTTSDDYATAFGFTEEEVFAAMDDMEMSEEVKAEVKRWYDGFTFGKVSDIYNPWSIINYLDKGKFDAYWANTSGNGLVGKVIRRGNKNIKMQFETLMNGHYIEVPIDEQIIFNQLDHNRNAIWSLMLASGYLKCIEVLPGLGNDQPAYRLTLTNHEVELMFTKLIRGWFAEDDSMDDFVESMLQGDEDAMNHYMNRIALSTFSYFDAGNKPSDDAPERFYHGFVLGLLVENANHYIITSNRQSGFGRYDVVICPKDLSSSRPAIIMEFKVFDERKGEKDLNDTADAALKQIEDRKYAADLVHHGIPEEKILKYGFAFRGQTCLIKKA
ncbi:MAG: AAA family ATPase [Lachnospiraceae bacterium]|nr:AAA family ATPase [Lachnospiraceae bacterium]